MDEANHIASAGAPKKFHTLSALFCYLGILLFIPLLKKEKDDFVSYHVNQGLVLFILEFIVGAVLSVLGLILQFASPILFTLLSFLSTLLGILFLFCHIVGIVHVFCHKQKKVPVFGEIKIYKPEETSSEATEAE